MKDTFYQARNWFFTDWDKLDWAKLYAEWPEKIRFVAWGEEICPSTGRPHNQGWLQLTSKRTVEGVKRLVGSKVIHLETRRGNEKQNEIYNSKEGKYKEVGKFILQGQHTDLDESYHAIMSGKKTIHDIANEQFSMYCRFRNGFGDAQEWADKALSKKFRKIEVIVHSGETGTGKTRKAMEGEDVYKICACDIKWFDGYQGEKTLVIDDYNNDIKINRLLNLLDGYQLRLPIKGGFTYARWTTVYITTNLTRDELHPWAKPAHRRALDRRITNWTNFSEFFLPKS